MTNAFTWVFLIALGLATATRLWLALRQIRHVRAHRDAVPRTFAEAIPLTAHQKAADYTVAKARLGMIEVLLGAAVLLALTLGGLIDWLSAQWSRVFDPQGLWHGAALFAAVVVLIAVLELPLSLYRTFVIEARFGFNRINISFNPNTLVNTADLGINVGQTNFPIAMPQITISGPGLNIGGPAGFPSGREVTTIAITLGVMPAHAGIQ